VVSRVRMCRLGSINKTDLLDRSESCLDAITMDEKLIRTVKQLLVRFLTLVYF
jgi:hypothetical protein